MQDHHIENFVRELRITLTPAEVAERADRAAQLLNERDHKEEELKAHSKHAKSEIATVESELRHVSGEVRTRSTYKPVECERVFDYRLGNVREIRNDTGEVLGERPMTDLERQRVLPLESDLEDVPTFEADGNGGLKRVNGNGKAKPKLATEKKPRARKGKAKPEARA